MPRQRNSARRHLELKRRVWWFKIGVPVAMRGHFGGKTHYRENLQTGDIREAMARRDQVERDTRSLFRQIEAGKVVSAATLSARERGTIWREALVDLRHADDHAEEGELTAYDVAVSAAEEEAERLRGKDRKEFAAAFAGKVPIDEHLETYLKAIKLADKTTNERRGLVKRFARWCDQEGLKLPDINRRAVGRYVTDAIEPMDRSTAKKHLTALRGYWDYLTLRGHVDGKVVGGRAIDSPWLGQTLPDNKRRIERGDNETERAFTTKELQALLYTDYPEEMDTEFRQQIEDALRISCLTGMRLAEVVTLWVEEVHDDLFDIQQGKTISAARRVPIHPDLKEIVERRTKDKTPKDWLFHELAKERDPGDTFGKRFKRYRKSLRVNDVREGKRRSLVNFHSARKWFITAARHAGQPLETIKDIVGHKPNKKEITFGVYTKGASAEQMRACVEAVKLPQPPLAG
ncbi:integrase [Mesorhizobium sp. LNHC252B00]|uniref:tyrosine-type recombinase/integrase n=1 Tax=Mesorhizobium sp. LNHC252B00 TaxID=1287252 RepID=UPI0003CF4B30|nr:integrase [Mesorhizobium sp. LNHC252B00]